MRQPRRVISVLVDLEQADFLRGLAESTERSVSHLVRHAIRLLQQRRAEAQVGPEGEP